MNANPEPSPSAVSLSAEQLADLERIATENKATSAHLVSLAVDALIIEAARHKGRLPLPENPGAL